LKTTHIIEQEEIEALMSIEEGARLLGVDPRWIRRNWRKLSFCKRLSPRKLRIIRSRLLKYIADQP
jgi:hypothetical protein